MRFKAKKEGTERIRTFFALFPVQVGDDTRWLEKVTVRERFYCDEDSACWYAEEFMDKKPNRFDLAKIKSPIPQGPSQKG